MAEKQNSKGIMLIAIVAIVAIAALSFTNLSGYSPVDNFQTKGASAREQPKGICVIEEDIEFSEIPTEPFSVLITEEGNSPAFAKIQSFWVFVSNGILFWPGTYTINDEQTIIALEDGLEINSFSFGGSGPVGVDLPGQVSNGFVMPSQAKTGQIEIPFIPDGEDAPDFIRFVAILESPVGNKCSIEVLAEEPPCVPEGESCTNDEDCCGFPFFSCPDFNGGVCIPVE